MTLRLLRLLASRMIFLLSAFVPFSTPLAMADRLPKSRETRPGVLDTTRTKALASDARITASLTFPRGEPKREKTFDVIVCLKSEGVAKADLLSALAGMTLGAVMPEHAHGMMVSPVRVAVRPGQEPCQTWRGLRFHMAGWWRLELRPAALPRTHFDFDTAPPL